MRKRLIERIAKTPRKKQGYTLMEMLAVVGIIVALLAVAIPSIIAISNALRFAQANNYAKSIFLAAQQNLTELRSDGGLDPVRNADGAYEIPSAMTTFPNEYRTEYVYTVTGTEAYERVLPFGSIDDSLRDDQIVIEYNPRTGNVYAVFYYSKNDLDLAGEYRDGELPREKDDRKKLKVGYYDGSGLNSSQIELEQTQAIVKFVNDEEGIIQVLVPMPESFFGEFNDFASALSVDLTISGEYSTANGSANDSMEMSIKTAGSVVGCELDVDGKTVIVEFPIDSLANRSSFVNYISGTQCTDPGEVSGGKSLTELLNENAFIYNILPGENITIQADVTFEGTGSQLVEISPGILSGVNPMFEYLQPSGNGGYVLAVSNGRNLQNLNALSPTIAKMVETVVFTDDIYWNQTVAYYNAAYGKGSTYNNTTAYEIDGAVVYYYDEAPARALPYFVPIHHEDLFGTARFIFPGGDEETSEDGGLGDYIWDKIKDFGEGVIKDLGASLNNEIPTLTDELDQISTKPHATIQGNGHKVYNLNIDSTKYQIPNVGRTEETTDANTGESVTVDYSGTFYATGSYQIIDYAFTGLFGYVNTSIDDLHVVNPIVKGYPLTYSEKSIPTYITIDLGIFGTITRPGDPKIIKTYNNPATGALVGASGYNTLITNCSTYVDKDADGYLNLAWGPVAYSSTGSMNWYGVSGAGAVGGLVGYAKSHLNVTGKIDNEEVALAFSNCFAAVPVSGIMWGSNGKQFGYSNGVGAFIGNSQLTNFYNCYASGDVLAQDCAVYSIDSIQGALRDLTESFGVTLQLLYNGRYSMGGGGFVGSSHGTRYTNCFATGNVTAYSSANSKHAMGGGGFVGFMSIDETFNYGHASNETANIAQRTIFTDCYSVGMATTNGTVCENFSGANGRIALKLNQSTTYFVGDYFRLVAPYYKDTGKVAVYSDDTCYIYRDSYFLSGYHTLDTNSQDNSSSCASPDTYSLFEDLVGNHEIGSDWMTGAITKIKNIYLYSTYKNESSWNDWVNIVETRHTYDTEYFQKITGLENTYKDLYHEGYSDEDWDSATSSTSHPYSLTAGQTYPFSKLKGMDYYGDWPNKPSDLGMAYYEVYQNDSSRHYYFDKEYTNDVALMLKNDETSIVTSDGYAIFSASNADLVVKVGDVTDTLHVSNEGTYTASNKSYHVFILSDKLMAALPSGNDFYVKVTAQHTDSSDKYIMYFNPNVALSHVNPMDGKKEAVEPDKAPTTIYVRSARQFKGISTLDHFWGKEYSYIQQLNIDAATYQWKDKTNDVKLDPIGTTLKEFDASYSAGYSVQVGEERQYKISGFQPVEEGIFGFIGSDGSVSDLIVECGDITVGTDKIEDVGVLAGVSYGKIDNVDLVLSGNVSLTADNCAGLLAGHVTGSVTDCDVTVAAGKNVSISAENAGGLIGTAEGKKDAKTTITNSKVTISGNLSFTNATNAGGIVGKAVHLIAAKTNAALNNVTADAAYAGGLAGYAEDSSFAGDVGQSNTGNPVEITINGTLTAANGYASGVIGGAKNTVLTGMDVTVNSVSGKIASGFLGTGDNADASNCIVTVTKSITGASGAAGVAGTIGSQSVFDRVPVNLAGVEINASAGNAAGYALEIKGEGYVNNSAVTLGGYNVTTDSAGKVTARTVKNRTTINASAAAAGYACTINGGVGTGNVSGCGAISGADAAGFAVTVNGSVTNCYVTPALSQDAAGYYKNSNTNLTVTGSSSAAGFAKSLAAKMSITSSYALCKVSGGANTYGFVGTNNGTINQCMANVDITGGYGFVATNNSLITTSYGWYNDPNNNAPAAAMTGTGRCNSSYFADMTPESRAVLSVTVYGADGAATAMTTTGLQNAKIERFTSGYAAYPYTEMNPAEYLYPMLRPHYGNWVAPPQYAYGVAYYETYADGTTKVHMVDLSDNTITEDGNVTFRNDAFDNNGVITGTGYARFYNSLIGPQEGTKMELTFTSGSFTYDFYQMEGTGVQTINKTTGNSKSAAVDTRFADAIKVNGTFGNNETYTVRTPEQLANIGVVTANFNQTHDITTADFTTAAIASGCTYNGKGTKLTVTGQTKTWLSEVQGTVTNLVLTVNGGVNAPVFGTVSGTVNTGAITTGPVSGSIFDSVSGNVTTGGIKTGAVTANLIKTLTSGTVTTGNITMDSCSASLVGTFNGGTLQGNAASKTTISIASGSADLNYALFANEVKGTVSNYSVAAASASSALVNILNGSMTNVSLNVTSVSDVANGILVNQVASGTVSGCSVTAGTVTTSGKTFGGLVGTNAGTLTGNTVAITTLNASGNAVVGGLAGTNSGAIDGNTTVNAAITYTSGSGATIGGLVGENSGAIGSTGNSITVSGGINRGDTSDGVYKIGGAIGNMTGGTAQNTTTAVTVATEWAQVNTSDATFGSSGITNNGPVGMFVGYAGNATLTSCTSTAANSTYQFLGQAKIDALALTNTWKSSVKKDGGVKVYDDSIVNGVYTSYAPSGVTFSAADNASRVAPTLSGCFFRFGDANKEQVYGVNEFYYTYSSARESKYTIGSNPIGPSISSESITYARKDYKKNKDKAFPTGKYYEKDGFYYLVSVVYTDDGSFIDIPSNPKFKLVETGNEGNVLVTKTAEYNTRKATYESTFTLHTLTQPQVNGTYIAVNSNGKALDSVANEYTVPASRTFEHRDTMIRCVWNGSGSTLTNVYDSTEYTNMTSSIDLTGTPVMSYNINGAVFNLYPVTETPSASTYSILTFTYQSNADYQRQYVTSK